MRLIPITFEFVILAETRIMSEHSHGFQSLGGGGKFAEAVSVRKQAGGDQATIHFSRDNVYHPCLSVCTQAEQKPFMLSGTETTRDDTRAATAIAEPWDVSPNSLTHRQIQLNIVFFQCLTTSPPPVN